MSEQPIKKPAPSMMQAAVFRDRYRRRHLPFASFTDKNSQISTPWQPLNNSCPRAVPSIFCTSHPTAEEGVRNLTYSDLSTHCASIVLRPLIDPVSDYLDGTVWEIRSPLRHAISERRIWRELLNHKACICFAANDRGSIGTPLQDLSNSLHKETSTSSMAARAAVSLKDWLDLSLEGHTPGWRCLRRRS
jgi:hypothetical protein